MHKTEVVRRVADETRLTQKIVAKRLEVGRAAGRQKRGHTPGCWQPTRTQEMTPWN